MTTKMVQNFLLEDTTFVIRIWLYKRFTTTCKNCWVDSLDWQKTWEMHYLTITQRLIVICLITLMVTNSQTIINMT